MTYRIGSSCAGIGVEIGRYEWRILFRPEKRRLLAGCGEIDITFVVQQVNFIGLFHVGIGEQDCVRNHYGLVQAELKEIVGQPLSLFKILSCSG